MKVKISSQQPAFLAFWKNRSIAFTLIELLVVISIIAILAGIALPVFTSVQTKGNQAKDLSNARQVGLGLRLYSADNNDYFPTTDPSTGSSSTTSNDAFLNIVPTYIPSQKIFWLTGSGWCTGTHPTELGTSGTLQAGTNTYSYVSGLTDTGNTNYPLVADGFTSATTAQGPGYYTTAQTLPGGVWKGTKAIVIFVDDSATIQTVTQSNMTVNNNGSNTDSSSTDIFTPGPTWMGTSAVILNPTAP